MIIGKIFEFFERRCQQRTRAVAVAARIVVKRGGALNQPLQKSLFWFCRSQPQLFPHFMRFEKLSRIEENDPAEKFLGRRLA